MVPTDHFFPGFPAFGPCSFLLKKQTSNTEKTKTKQSKKPDKPIVADDKLETL